MDLDSEEYFSVYRPRAEPAIQWLLDNDIKFHVIGGNRMWLHIRIPDPKDQSFTIMKWSA